MRRIHWTAPALLALTLLSGCHNSGSRRSLVPSEPALAPTADSGGTSIVTTPPTKSVTFVDRHPLFSKPRQYYESSGDNKIVKTAAATVVGVPAGIVGELKQIVVGAPVEPKY